MGHKKKLLFAIGLSIILTITSCMEKELPINDENTTTFKKTTMIQEEDTKENFLKIGFLFDEKGVSGDEKNKAFWQSIQETETHFSVEKYLLEAATPKEYYRNASKLAQKKPDLLCAFGENHADTLLEVAQAFPEQKILALEMAIFAPNIWALQFNEKEIAYLSGVTASLLSEKPPVFFLPQEKEVLKYAFMAGQKEINNKASVTIICYQGEEEYLNRLKEISEEAHDVVVILDVPKKEVEIHPSLKVIQSAYPNEILLPNTVMAFEKHVDVLLQHAITKEKQGKFESGIQSLGFYEQALTLTYVKKKISWLMTEEINPKKEILEYRSDIQWPQTEKELKRFKKLK